MAIAIAQDKKRQRYLIFVLALVIFAILFVAWRGFFRKEEAAPTETTPAVIYVLPKVKIDWQLLGKSLNISEPALTLQLISSPSPVSPGAAVDLEINILDKVIITPLAYKIDCESDGEYELTVKNISEKKYLAKGVCKYEKEGEYLVGVLAEGRVTYFSRGIERTEEKSSRATAEISVKEPNSAPFISFCDISATEGSTVSGQKLEFKAAAGDPDGDKLSYLWNFGDGNTASQPNVSYQYKNSGVYFPAVRVFDLTEDGEKKGEEDSCYPSSLSVFGLLQPVAEIPQFKGNFGRDNPFMPY